MAALAVYQSAAREAQIKWTRKLLRQDQSGQGTGFIDPRMGQLVWLATKREFIQRPLEKH
jgi:hypothetical protein